MKMIWIFLAAVAFFVVFAIIPGGAIIYIWQETSWPDKWKWIATVLILVLDFFSADYVFESTKKRVQ